MEISLENLYKGLSTSSGKKSFQWTCTSILSIGSKLQPHIITNYNQINSTKGKYFSVASVWMVNNFFYRLRSQRLSSVSYHGYTGLFFLVPRVYSAFKMASLGLVVVHRNPRDKLTRICCFSCGFRIIVMRYDSFVVCQLNILFTSFVTTIKAKRTS